MKVVFYHRLPLATGNFSIERFFSDVRGALPGDIECVVVRSRFHSVGLWKRLFNAMEAVFRQGDVNHITGDVQYLAIGLRRHKTILSVMDCSLLHRTHGLKWLIAFVVWYWLPAARSQCIVVISESTKRELLKFLKCPEDKVRVIHCPVSSCFRPFVKQFNADRPVILQFNTGKNKNLERVAEALAGIPCQLRVVGCLDEEQAAAMHRFGIESSVVSNISDDQVVEEYRQCDILLLASTYEGFGLPIVEAQATGRPVVTSNLLSMPEVAGGAACLVDPFNPTSIRDGVLKIITDSTYRDGLVKRGLENVERFRPETIARQYRNVYREVVGEA